MKTLLNQPYDSRENALFDLYLPDDPASCRFAVIWFYGGGLVNGRKEDYAFLAPSLTSRGITLALPNYRLMPEFSYPAFIQDAAKSVFAVRSALSSLSVDASLIAGGSSAGAYLSMMLCFDSSYLAAENLTPSDIQGYLFNSGQPTAHFGILKSKGIDERRIIIDDTSALYHVDESIPRRPMLLLLAENDMPSRVTQNRLLHETLLRFGADEKKTEIEILPGFGHCGYDKMKEDDGEYILAKRILHLIDLIVSA
ncbi:MAG: alpha/beta hydrolase [Clostridia bacterium]|nr:alpha/beta hydrolase [Clostridia bacterium]